MPSHTVKHRPRHAHFRWHAPLAASLLLAVLALLAAAPAAAQSFPILNDPDGDGTTNPLTGVSDGSSDWADYDADGDLDLVVTGQDAGRNETATIYRNDGGGTFTDIGAGLTGVDNGSSSDWGDYDADGDLDLVVTGRDADFNSTATIYRNDGGGTFTDIGAGLTGVDRGSSEWADYDADGDLDLVVTGQDASNDQTATIYRNDGGGTFTPLTSAGLTDVSDGSSDWGDYDADGDLDLVVTGRDAGFNPTVTIYTGDGAGGFTPLTSAGLTGVFVGSSDWGDYDADGDLDLVVTGQDASNNQTATIYRNDGGGTFTDISAGLTGVIDASSEWGDYDQDGDLDLVVTGSTNNFPKDPTATIYTGDGADGFTPLTSAGLTDVSDGSSDWGDYDQDGDLDLVVTGQDAGSASTATIYENQSIQQAPASSATTSVAGPGSVPFGATSIRIDFAAGTFGPANVTVARFDDPPSGTSGLPAGDNVSSYRTIIAADAGFAIGSGTEVRFDVSAFDGITVPADVTIYSRPGVGTGTFAPLPTADETTGGTTELVATVDGFSEFVFVSSTNPLPVELSAFDAQATGESVALTWQTVSETNNAGFEIQRQQTSGTSPEPTWERISFVEGAGTTDEPQSYRFRDTAPPFADSLVYRLKQIDIDGTESFSDPVAIQQGLGAEVQLSTPFPNPVQQQATVRYIVPEGEAQPVRLQVYNILGQRVATLVDESKTPGREEVALDASRWASGTYFLRLQVGGETKTQRVTVVR